ncbi:MAG: hypothetical protein H6962_09520 [Chromatiaceae bacterium]|nr:hypothetical protein [Chromatiaceae bacterium]
MVLLLWSLTLFSVPAVVAANEKSDQIVAETLTTLSGIISLRAGLQSDVREIRTRLAQAQSDAERAVLVKELEKAEADLQTVSRNFESVATGVDASKLRTEGRRSVRLSERDLCAVAPRYR